MMCKNGFTLVEMMITLVVAAILIGLAVPSYFNMVQNNHITATVNKLSASLNYARLEAIKRGEQVSVCAASSAALNACGTNAQWAQGWVVFVDENDNNVIDVGDTLIRVNEQLPPGITITTVSSVVSYDGTGFLNSNATNFTVSASGCTGDSGRQLAIAGSGRLSLSNVNCP
ncbi:GspH/FimT family pseudopilin [Legionella sp. W05-934-2]|jgi:type IV fimbrial biogenesis protein FimT|uniref:GspH/FimT family pseudopilin n=1 Tax=Legionella sp. W05-934-2 TaxID=1198649 RepID=UPI00346377B9